MADPLVCHRYSFRRDPDLPTLRLEGYSQRRPCLTDRRIAARAERVESVIRT